MSEYLNISQIARELNVSRQAIYSKLKSPEIQSVICQYTVRHNNRTLYTSNFANVLKQAFESVNTVQTLDTICQEEVSSPLQSQLDLLKAQLTDKDNQINLLRSQVAELQSDKEKLNARLDRAEAERERFDINISNLTAALTAAQALHGMDKQQTVIDIKQEPEEPQKELAEAPPQQKLSFFDRLFKRK